MKRPSIGAVFIVAVLLVLWRTGTFDNQLAGAGLNAKPCGSNALGQTICGKQYEILHAAQDSNEERQEHEAAAEVPNNEYVHQAGTEAEGRSAAAGGSAGDKRTARREAEAEAEKELEEQERRKQDAQE